MSREEGRLAQLRAAYEARRISKELYEENVRALGGTPEVGEPRPPPPHRSRDERPRRRLVIVIVAGAVIAASLAGGILYYLNTGLTTSGATGYELRIAPDSLAVAPGGTATYSIALSAVGGYRGKISLSASGFPDRSGASFTPPFISLTAYNVSTLRVDTPSSVSEATYTVTVIATDGTLTRTAAASLEVTHRPIFALDASPPSRAVAPGADATFTVTVTALNGYHGSVSLSVASGLPAGASAQLTPPAVQPTNSSSLRITRTSNLADGTYTLTVSGTDGSATQTTTVDLIVSKSGTGPQWVHGVLVFDPTGTNYVGGRGTRGGGGTTAYFTPVDTSTGTPTLGQPVSVKVAESTPLAVTGDFLLADTPDGKAVSSSSFDIDTIASNLLSADIRGHEFQNVAVNLLSVGVPYGNHTFGIGLGNTTDYAYVGLPAVPTMFTPARVVGTVLPWDFVLTTGFLNVNLSTDLGAIKSSLQLALPASFPAFLLVQEITYAQTTNVRGDALDVVRPEEVAQLILNLSGEEIDNATAARVMNIAKSIHVNLVTFGEENDTVRGLDRWFVLANQNLTREKLTGVVTLRVAESDLASAAARLGVSFNPTNRETVALRVHLAVADANAIVANSTYAPEQVRDLRGLLAAPHATTMVATVTTTGFVVALDAENFAEYMGRALGLDSSTMSALRALYRFRNPAFGLLIDRRFPDAFVGSGASLWDYASLVYVPDFPLGSDFVYYMDARGVVYDTWRFLNINPPLLGPLPLLVTDAIANSTAGMITDSLAGLATRTDLQNVNLIQTSGYIVGSTVKTVLQFTPFSNIVKFLPIDVGVYDISNESGGTRYHAPVVYLTGGTGPTFLAEHVRVRALYVRDTLMRDRVASLGSNLLDDGFLLNLLKGLVTNITENFGSVKMLDGFFLAYSIVRLPIPENLRIDHLSADDELTDGNQTVRTNITAWIKMDGSFSLSSVHVRFVVTSPNGTVYVADSRGFILGIGQTVPVQPLFAIQLPRPLPGTYRAEAYLTRFLEFGTTIDYASTAFRLVLDTMSPGPFHLYAPWFGLGLLNADVTLSWTASREPFLNRYEVHFSTIEGFTPSTSTLLTTTTGTSMAVTGLSSNVHYYYRIRAVDTGGRFAHSNEAASFYTTTDTGDYPGSPYTVAPMTAWSETLTCGFASCTDGNDGFRISLAAGQTLYLNLTVPIGADFNLYLYDGSGALVDYSATLGSFDEHIAYSVTAPGNYYVVMESFARPIGNSGRYGLILETG